MTATARDRILDSLWRAFDIACRRGDIVAAIGFGCRIQRLTAS